MVTVKNLIKSVCPMANFSGGSLNLWKSLLTKAYSDQTYKKRLFKQLDWLICFCIHEGLD